MKDEDDPGRAERRKDCLVMWTIGAKGGNDEYSQAICIFGFGVHGGVRW